VKELARPRPEGRSSATVFKDDKEIVERLRQRDANAMAELYDKYAGLLYSVILRSVANQATAEDLVQETFLRIWNRIHTFDVERGRLEGWIVTIARNRAIDYLRSLRHKPSESSTTFEDLERASLFVTSELETDRLLKRKAVGAALERLNEEQREVLELTHFQGLTQTEIAQRMQKPLGTVKSLVRSALKLLRASVVEAGRAAQ
jgi:RNA polymerase sigma-70 factor, ECF subfamily